MSVILTFFCFSAKPFFPLFFIFYHFFLYFSMIYIFFPPLPFCRIFFGTKYDKKEGNVVTFNLTTTLKYCVLI